ncbi:PLP-dependent aminotransferase family protein [Nocardia farcinica]|uniref:aminotransferase-like domain-containing protein n=1 Tax=Nocardia farcinica TaxID=37329 RepID=UPI001895633F|nr:PLP-dependent aminotransferase family protein [Nocardia farcinica]MBF6261517.1 PLP-dependent aminotransferase family protein [Nocardia farcinica]MBF6278814.1 PLP-dependent aminotransferase family protein [Nocardia farcinica]MBF6304528.1 PLP-dependent aminotransferase family protein [Nocardia farcinica]MBF6359765.1 PLP-dependent aminotransferase family protein [Nocardia farcinica]MBF6389569.1 PLP-dependent aminotransferase family protein [Nocardia farcinica]
MPSYRSVADLIAEQITAGRWAPGDRLPTHRQLAAEFGIAIATATRVYAELKRTGVVVGEPGRGTFVRDRSVRLVSPEYGPGADTVWADLSITQPFSRRRSELLRAALRELATAGELDAVLRRPPPGGRPHERRAAAGYPARLGIEAEAERVFLTSGAQHGLDLVLRATLAPGDAVAVDELTYPGFRMLAEAQRLDLVPIPADGDGPDLTALAQACARRRLRAVYTMPTLHNPLGWVLNAAARAELIALARKHDLLLIEDAAYAFLADPAPPPLAALAPERTFWVSSISKSVSAGLRFGLLVTPASARNALSRIVRTTMAGPSSLVTALVVRWLSDGTLADLEAASREAAAEHQRILRRELDGRPMRAHPRSYFAWLPVDPGQRMDRVAAELSRRGIRVSTADLFATTPHVPHGLRLAVGSLSPRDLPNALAVVRDVLDDIPL